MWAKWRLWLKKPSSDSVSPAVVNSKALAGGLVITTINMIVVAG
jgi:hypothetical protein